MTRAGESEQILFVCTANVCRSPMAQVLMQQELAARCQPVRVLSAGFLMQGKAADSKAVGAMRRLGVDLGNHVSAKVDDVLRLNPDLILVMAREHLRSIARLEPALAARSFTIKEFAQLGELEGPRQVGEPIDEYLRRLAVSRSAAALTSPRKDLDVMDPIGRSSRAFGRCASELEALVGQVADVLYPWPNSLSPV